MAESDMENTESAAPDTAPGAGKPVHEALDSALAKRRAALEGLARQLDAAFTEDDADSSHLEDVREAVDLILEDVERLERLERIFGDRAGSAYPLGA